MKSAYRSQFFNPLPFNMHRVHANDATGLENSENLLQQTYFIIYLVKNIDEKNEIDLTIF
ncbi:hypothetical protein AKJ40_00180 [candidate division MSBL1 archaeon SCGC-AAA259M10]|uniref:Uncharacterized protein n=2 Tax=candidate division MSBL1 TaxID=215777 RepID=A0A133V363_9EURY|nr:hypothetical protein AKJ36_00580 [candidate division MSBL1 archaeon SCGC-AAA259I07]KXB00888.1 hypothetical protein AKJ40_00180 [candidate division MSBL1 archaeon SCGC-AAA259M10]